MKLKLFILCLISFGFAFNVSAQELVEKPVSSVISAYSFYKNVDDISINVPTVVEVPFTDEFIERLDFAVLDNTTNSFEPYFLKEKIDEIPFSVSTNANVDNPNLMNDNDIRTYSEFALPENAKGSVQITLSSSKPITASTLTTLLDNNVALPGFIEIRAFVKDQNTIVLAKQIMEQQTIHFPKTTSDKWLITFNFGQPLRITELSLYQDEATKTNDRAIRFLAQPEHSYSIYFDPDRTVVATVGEAGDLSSAKDVLIMPTVKAEKNPAYVAADIDEDGVLDMIDNCISVANTDQQDVNENGRGDACDDFDQDGIINTKDNCPDKPNRYQEDTDSDKIGDVCDGEESRVTERYTWIPWVGMGFAGLVLVTLIYLTVKPKKAS